MSNELRNLVIVIAVIAALVFISLRYRPEQQRKNENKPEPVRASKTKENEPLKFHESYVMEVWPDGAGAIYANTGSGLWYVKNGVANRVVDGENK